MAESASLRDSDDVELVQRAIEAPEGDLRAFETIVQKYRKTVVANCRYMTRDSGQAEDLAQDIFLKIYFTLKGFEGRSSFRTWLYRIKVNHCLNHLKKEGGRHDLSLEDPGVADRNELTVPPAVEKSLSEEDKRRQIGNILDSLTETLRVPLIMCDVDELSYQEVADAMGIGLSAAKMRIKRAREEFVRRYQSSAND